MKKTASVIAVLMILSACNHSGKDPVEKADSANAVFRDAMPRELLQADKETANFLVEAAESSVLQSQMSELAFQKGLNQQLKSLAGKMMHDHSLMNESIKKLAEKLQVTVPHEPGDNNQKRIQELKAKDTRDFDRELTDAMVHIHEDELGLFNSASKKVNNADVKSFIDNGLPQLKLHLDSLKLLQKILR